MNEVNTLAFDFGEKRIGVAIGNNVAKIASPLSVVNNDANKWAHIKKLVADNDIKELVVGLPRNMSGEETKQSVLARGFAKELEEQTGLKVSFVDESLTSVLSEQKLSGSKKGYAKSDIDMQSAVKILQDYLG